MRGAIPPLLQYVFIAWCLVKQRDVNSANGKGESKIEVFTVLFLTEHHAMKAY
jgi:hypothetical protein